MPESYLIDYLPLGAVFGATILVCFIAIELGFRLGRRRRKDSSHEGEAPVGAIVAAALGLLAFMLAFTFSMAASRFETRRDLVIEESNAIGTADLRAEMLSEPARTEIHRLLREYINLRTPATPSLKIGEIITKSDALQSALWSQARIVAEKNPNQIIAGLFIQALNEVIDLHAKRVAALLYSRIPFIIWIGLYALALLSMALVGYLSGLTGPRSLVAMLALVMAFSAVMQLVMDLDRPFEGILKTNQRPLLELRDKLNAAAQDDSETSLAGQP